MTSDLKLLEWLVRGVVVALSGLGIWKAEWFGRRIFDSYLSEHHLNLFRGPSSALYPEWFRDSVIAQPGQIRPLWNALGFLLLIALIAHIVARAEVDQAGSKSNASRSVAFRVYLRRYDLVTVGLFVPLMLFYFFSHPGANLPLLLYSITIPSILYLFFYSADLRSIAPATGETAISLPSKPTSNPTYVRLLVYVLLMVSALVVVIAWPSLEGAQAFDLRVTSVSGLENVENLCETARFREGGPIFWVRGTQYFRLCLNQDGTEYSLDFFESATPGRYRSAPESFQLILSHSEKFATPKSAEIEATLKRAKELVQP